MASAVFDPSRHLSLVECTVLALDVPGYRMYRPGVFFISPDDIDKIWLYN
jgi:uncharacterized protein YcsI (UPF0317 family)